MEEQKEKIYSSYTDAQKRATKKYRENNKDKVNEQRKKYYQNRKTKDPNFLIYKRQKAKEYYAKKKDRIKALKEHIGENRLKSKDFHEDKIIKEAIEKTELHKLIEEVKEPVKEVIIEKVEIHEYPVLDETKEEKKKRKYIRKNKTA
jgi:hypothetical protein